MSQRTCEYHGDAAPSAGYYRCIREMMPRPTSCRQDPNEEHPGCFVPLPVEAPDPEKEKPAGSCLEEELRQAGAEIHQIAVDHGWWESDRNDYECIALMHAELSELVEGLRHGNPASDHLPEFSAAEEEAADVVIRLLDTCHVRGWRLGEAIVAKVKFNRSRPYRHGGKRA